VSGSWKPIIGSSVEQDEKHSSRRRQARRVVQNNLQIEIFNLKKTPHKLLNQ
jgi:hypothetical protein